MSRRLVVRLRGEAGFTLVELMTVMVIMGIVLAGLTVMFRAGVQAEMRAHREYRAQQNARLALDKMRRELHCASAVTPNATPATSITVTLPTACFGPDTSVTYATELVATDRYRLTRAAGAGTGVEVADYLTLAAIFTYYAPASGELGRLAVDIPVNLNPPDTGTEWRLKDDIVLRNTTRL